jgi:non-ribosomal peptide synthetase-like protein
VGPNARIPANELWDGVPAMRAGVAPGKAALADGSDEITPASYAVRLVVARIALALLLAAPFELGAIAAVQIGGVSSVDVVAWMTTPIWNLEIWLAIVGLTMVPLPAALVLQAVAARWLSRRLEPGTISRWSTPYLRVWLVTDLVRSSGDWLSGTLMWPRWLRLAGMTIGSDGEISTIIDVVPALVRIDQGCFLADGIYLAGPNVHRGVVTLARTAIGANTFIGNHAVIGNGQQLPPDLLIGVCTVADDRRMHRASSWFGHPPFPLARRPMTSADRRLTHDPSWIRRANRWCWELLRLALPIVPVAAALLWTSSMLAALELVSLPVFVFLLAPLISAATAAGFCLLVLALKWLLLGRVAPGQHALWSCWCSRWDFLYVAWARLAQPVLAGFEGTLWLPWYLRLMGMRIGRRVVLGSGFAQVVDPDMIQIDDEATVHALFQAHTFEDRVLKIDVVRIGRRANVANGVVLFYGANIGEDASVAPGSVVMKHEQLPAGRAYEGCPVRPVGSAERRADLQVCR